MPSKDDEDDEPTTFRRKELSARNSGLTSISIASFLCVLLGVGNCILFTGTGLVPADYTRPLNGCSLLFPSNSTAALYSPSAAVAVWSAVGVFAIFAFVIAPIARATSDAWTWKSTAFVYLAPLLALLSLAIAAASGLLTACYIKNFADKMSGITDIAANARIFYCIVDVVVVILGLVLFVQLLVVWSQVRGKRSRSEGTRLREKEEREAMENNNNKKKKKEGEEEEEEESAEVEATTATPAVPPPAAAATTTTPAPQPAQVEKQPPPAATTATTATTQPQPPTVFIIQTAPPVAEQYQQPPPYSPYDNPFYPSLPLPYPALPPAPMAMTLPPPMPPMRRRPRPGGHPFRKRFAVRVSPGYQASPWGY